MSETDISISKTTIIGRECLERFLPVSMTSAFAEAGILLGGESRLLGEYSIFRKRAEFELALYTLSGEGLAAINGKIKRLSPGTLLHLPSGTEHSYCIGNDGEWDILWFHLGSGFSAPLPSEVAEPRISRQSPSDELTHLVRACISREVASTENTANLEYYASLLAYALRSEFHSDATSLNGIDGETAAKFSAIIAKIAKSPASDWSVGRLAKLAGMSEGHFQRTFKKWSGESPMRKVSEVRMRKAQEYLRHTNFRIQEIAEATGYANQFAFSKAFKRQLGVSPSEIKKF